MLLRSEGAAELELPMPWVGHKVCARSSRAGARLGEGDGENERIAPEPHRPLFPGRNGFRELKAGEAGESETPDTQHLGDVRLRENNPDDRKLTHSECPTPKAHLFLWQQRPTHCMVVKLQEMPAIGNTCNEPTSAGTK